MSMRSVGLLKLALEDAESYQAALERYGYATSAAFLRACALALIKHQAAHQRLLSPLAFQTLEHQSKEP